MVPVPTTPQRAWGFSLCQYAWLCPFLSESIFFLPGLSLSPFFVCQATSSNNSMGALLEAIEQFWELACWKKIFAPFIHYSLQYGKPPSVPHLISASLKLQQNLTTQGSEVTKPRPIIPHKTCGQVVLQIPLKTAWRTWCGSSRSTLSCWKNSRPGTLWTDVSPCPHSVVP